MKATEARALAKKNAPIVAKRRRDSEVREAAKTRAILHLKRKTWREKFEANVRESVGYAVENGETQILKPVYVGSGSTTTYSDLYRRLVHAGALCSDCGMPANIHGGYRPCHGAYIILDAEIIQNL